MQHLDEGTIHSWLDGALSADEAARVQAHVAECRQCAAAVAEARGFIAASSRILTALDNAPRGVIPVTAPVKRVNPVVWRIAATVLVVAAGTLVMVQNRESTQPLKAVSENQTTVLAQPTEEAMERGSDAAAAAAADGAPAGAAASQVPQSNALMSKVPAVVLSEKEGTGTARRGVTMGNSRELGKGTSVVTGRAAGVTSDYSATPAAAAPPPPVAPSRAEAAIAMDAAAEPERLKVVGSPLQIGAKVTLYEVASGDTVTLTESAPGVLNSVVLRGAASMAPQAAGQTAAAAPREQAAASAATDSRRTRAVAPPAPPVAAQVQTAKVGSAITIHTISWRDPATGSTLTLSGRMPEARLQEIKIRIDRERAAAAAAAKKNP